MTAVAIRLIGLATGAPHDASGQWVVSYDADYHLPDGSYDGGALVTTPDRTKALEMTPEDAFQLWRRAPQCSCHRTRADGQPNRPLTAFTVVFR